MGMVVMTHIPDELGPEEDVEKTSEAQPGQAGQQETWNGVNINLRDVKKNNVANNADRSSLSAP